MLNYKAGTLHPFCSYNNHVNKWCLEFGLQVCEEKVNSMGMPFDWHLPGSKAEALKGDSLAVQGKIPASWSFKKL